MKIKISKAQWEGIGRIAGWDIHDQKPVVYTYHINLNERGSFYADVRNSGGKTVFEIRAGDELKPGESSIFEDGYMKGTHDMDGLKEYLVELGIMKPNQRLKDMDLYVEQKSAL